MRKIPTVFRRDPEDMRHVLPEVHPDCQWVLDGEGTPTRKYDGTCVMIDDGGNWWARREVKPGQTTPAGFVPAEHDEVTGKTVGWEPIYQSDWVKFWDEAWTRQCESGKQIHTGTYELCGPKINGNPERFEAHTLVRHADAEVIPHVGLSYEWLAEFMPNLAFEGIVWHHPDGRMAKLKRRDFAVDPLARHPTPITWKDSPVLADGRQLDDLLHVEPDGSVTAKTGLPPFHRETWS